MTKKKFYYINEETREIIEEPSHHLEIYDHGIKLSPCDYKGNVIRQKVIPRK